MVRKFLGFPVFALLALALPAAGRAQNIEGQIVASQFSQWQIVGRQPLIAGTNSQVFFGPCALTAGGRNFIALSDNAPITIVDPSNSANNETTTPSNVAVTATGCTATLTTNNAHALPYSITSGSGGAQEAINANSNGIANTVILDQRFYAFGGSANVIESLVGNTVLGLVDVTTIPYSTYSWSAPNSEYVPSPGNAPAPQVVFGTGAGSSPTGLTVTGTSAAFNVSFTSGAAPTAAQSIFNVTFPAGVFSTFAPGCSVTSKNQNMYLTGTVDTNLGAMQFVASSTALSAATSYSFRVVCE